MVGIPLNSIILVILALTLPLEINLITMVSLITIWLLSPLVLDLDHPTSKLTSWGMSLFLGMGLIGIILDIQYLILIGLAVTALIHFMSTISVHRGIVHSIAFCIVFGLIIGLGYSYYISYNSGIFFGLFTMFGVYTHLIGDRLYLKFI